MQTDNYNDVTALRIELNELKSQFDRSMRDGENFDRVKVIHAQIKELECHLNALEWHPGMYSERSRSHETFTRGINQRRFRHIEEPPPLL